MKNIIKLSFCLMLMLFTFAGYSQEKPVTKKVIKVADVTVKDTVIKTIKYQIYTGKSGGRYIIRTSNKSGNEYKSYLKKKL